MKFFLSFIILLTLLLTSCGKSDEKESSSKAGNSKKMDFSKMGKSNFLIETKKISEFNSSYDLKKSGKIISNQVIDIKSQTSGEISKIYVKDGQKIAKGQLLVSIKDDFRKNALAIEKAKISLDKTKIDYDTRLISLDKSISDTKLNLNKIKKDIEIEKAKMKEDIKKAKIDLANTKYEDKGSKSNLDLEKLNANIKKQELAYDNAVATNKEQIRTYIDNVKKEYNGLSLSLYDIIDFSDKILGVSDENKNKNDSFENYLGAKDTILKSETEKKLKNLINYYENDFKKIDAKNISEDNVIEFLNNFKKTYENISGLLNGLESTLNSSVESTSLSSTIIDSYISSVNSYQSKNQSSQNSYISTLNTITTFLNTYKSKEALDKKSIELLYKDKEILEQSLKTAQDTGSITYNKIVLGAKDNLNTLENNLASAELAYKNAIKTKEVTLKTLKSNINSAKNTYDSSLQELAKLSVRSPINGIVSEVMVDEGEYASNQNLVTIVGNKTTKVEVNLSQNELFGVSVGDKVVVDIQGGNITHPGIPSLNSNGRRLQNKEKQIIENGTLNIVNGNVYSISSVADENLNYKVKIIVNSRGVLNTGVVGIVFKIKLDKKILVPIDSVKIIGGSIGTLSLYKDGKIEELKVSVGKVYGDMLEIKGVYDNAVRNASLRSLQGQDFEIILTDLRKYNPKRNKLVKSSPPAPLLKEKGVVVEEEELKNMSENEGNAALHSVQEGKNKEEVDISSMTREERRAYFETLSDEERDELRKKRGR